MKSVLREIDRIVLANIYLQDGARHLAARDAAMAAYAAQNPMASLEEIGAAGRDHLDSWCLQSLRARQLLPEIGSPSDWIVEGASRAYKRAEQEKAEGSPPSSASELDHDFPLLMAAAAISAAIVSLLVWLFG